MKIAIIGYSGAGKSTLAKSISVRYNIPLLYLDTVNFQAGWKERDNEECTKIINNFMNNKSWVIDGNYIKFNQSKRLKEADKIIFMNFSRLVCFTQAFKRYLKSRNSVRESMSDGCIEKFDFEFIKWILIDGRNKKHKLNYNNIINKYKNKVIMCRNHKDVESVINNLSFLMEDN